jgi:lysophospholipase L1-like esterase
MTFPILLRERPDFLGHDFGPNVNIDYTQLRTNSFGMADREYSMPKPPDTRRIAVLGDSLSRGMGASFGNGWEPLLEEQLNQAHRDRTGQAFEVLNFAVDGYSITQLVEVAVEKASPFEPDVYLVVLTDRMISPGQWLTHFALLTRRGSDLKYGFLEQIAEQAGIARGEPDSESRKKLTPYRLQTLRGALSEINTVAKNNGAPVVVVFLSSLGSLSSAEDFLEVSNVVAEIGLPVISLLDTFDDVTDLQEARFENVYIEQGLENHPNDLGYRLLFENLYQKLQKDPELLSLLLGQD